MAVQRMIMLPFEAVRRQAYQTALIIDTRVGGKKLIDRLSTKSNVEDGKSVTSSAQPNGGSPTP